MDNRYINSDQDICHGAICFRGTRIMVYLVLELLEAGVTTKEILRDYYPQLTKKHIDAALHLAAEMVRTGQYVPLKSS